MLEEALKSDVGHITEISEDGSVPELAFESNARARVLLVDGEELIGARQNRTLNTPRNKKPAISEENGGLFWTYLDFFTTIIGGPEDT